jgi:hypothetical protein
MKINLHIERLVLEALPLDRHQGAAVGAALEAELTRLLLADGLAGELRAGAAMPSVRAGAINITNDTNVTQLGSQIARAVHGGIGTKQQR